MPVPFGPSSSSDDEAGTAAGHLVVLIVCAGIFLSAALLTPSTGNLKIGPVTLPGLCVLRNTTGVPCPGCGLTRSVVAAVHGDWNVSFAYHRMGPLIVGFLILQLLYRLAWMGLPLFRAQINRVGRLFDWALIPLMVLLFLNWIPTVIGTLRTAF